MFSLESASHSTFTFALAWLAIRCGVIECCCPKHIRVRPKSFDSDRKRCREALALDPDHPCDHIPTCVTSVAQISNDEVATLDVNLDHTNMESNTIAQFSELFLGGVRKDTDGDAEDDGSEYVFESARGSSKVLYKIVVGTNNVEVDEQ